MTVKKGMGYQACTTVFLISSLIFCYSFCFNQTASAASSQWPQVYSVVKDTDSGLLTYSTPYYQVQHDLNQGGIITRIHYTHGKADNILAGPITTRIRIEGKDGGTFSDIYNNSSSIRRWRDGKSEILIVECQLLDEKGRDAGVKVTTKYEYRWGYFKINKELIFPQKPIRIKSLTVVSAVFDPSLTDYGYRQGMAEQAGASPFSFGVCQWAKMRTGTHFDPPLQTRHIPRYVVLANHGFEGIEWFVSSDLAQWDYQLTGKPGDGYCTIGTSLEPYGVSVSIDPLNLPRGSLEMKSGARIAYDYYMGMPILEGHANKPWLHTGFNRNKGNWLSKDQIREMSENGIKTIHCHNDGDYYRDGLFWRDGTYPPYPPEDMEKYDKVVETCQKYGMSVATYFSNKELHPVTEAFKRNGEKWGRKPDDQGKLRHNYYSGDEFGAQMCLKSGWLEHLKFTIDRVLTNHKLNGVYYDWNVALYCNNPLHVGKESNIVSGEMGLGSLALSPTGHWDMDELINLMEWTRERVGLEGLIILHNTMAPMFVTENFADYVVGMEWGYGKLLKDVPPIRDLPLEWNFAGARSRGVIGYGTIARNAPQRLHQLLALETLLTGVAPWPASQEAIKLYKILRPLGDIEQYKFEDWRNQAVNLTDEKCESAVYSRLGEAYILLGNFEPVDKRVSCAINSKKLPFPISTITSARLFNGNRWIQLNTSELNAAGTSILIPADNAVLLHIK